MLGFSRRGPASTCHWLNTLSPSLGGTITENAPENLRKFLESNDPALVLMGLSMAKGSEIVPDKILGGILWMYMFNDDTAIRTAAKSAFMKLAPKDAKKVVRDNWKMKYRTQSFFETFFDNEDMKITELKKLLKENGLPVSGTKADLIERIKTTKKFKNCKVGDCEAWVRRVRAAAALNSLVQWPPTEKKIGHVSVIQKEGSYWESDSTLGAYIHPATLLIAHDLASTISIVEPFCKELKHDEYMVRLVTAKALGMICDAKSVPSLIRLLKKEGDWALKGTVVKALGKIGDSRAVTPLIKILGNSEESWNHPAVAKALGKIGDKRAVEPLVKLQKNKAEYYSRVLRWSESKTSGWSESKTSVYNDVQQATSKALNRLDHPN